MVPRSTSAGARQMLPGASEPPGATGARFPGRWPGGVSSSRERRWPSGHLLQAGPAGQRPHGSTPREVYGAISYSGEASEAEISDFRLWGGPQDPKIRDFRLLRTLQ